MRCVLCVPRLRGLSTRAAFSPQVPLGHVLVGSQLIRAGHSVTLIDADIERLSISAVVDRIRSVNPGCLLVGHPASTIAHSDAINTMRAVRSAMPKLPIVYGGVYPTYSADGVLAEGGGAVDYVVTHEAERSAPALVNRLEAAGGD